MHTIACALPNRANDAPADRCRSFLLSPYNARKVRRWKWSLPGYSRTWYLSRQRENKKSFAIKRDETNTEPLSGVNGAPCRNCTPGFIVFRLRLSNDEKRKSRIEQAKKGERKEVRLKILSRRHHSPLRSWDGQWGSKRFMSHFASIYLPGRQTFARESCRTFLHTPSCY